MLVIKCVLHIGYLIAQYPAGYLLQRLPAGKFIGVTAIVWGILMMTTPACVNFAGIAANRFLLGVVEAVVNPGFVLIMVSLGSAPTLDYLSCPWGPIIQDRTERKYTS